jgi:class 3 adenylate cyclase
MPAVRRLAAILAADVAGYSRLMGADEEDTHERLKAHRRELVEPKIGEHSERIVGPVPSGSDIPRYALCKIAFGKSNCIRP